MTQQPLKGIDKHRSRVARKERKMASRAKLRGVGALPKHWRERFKRGRA